MRCLILIDIQNDFVSNGSLSILDGESIIPLVNKLQQKFSLVVASQDWHPVGHCSFASNHKGNEVGNKIIIEESEQILWPDHCIQNTFGSDLVATLARKKINKFIKKGTDKNIDSYSCFFDNQRKRNTGLLDYLQDNGVLDIYIVGLATDYCVKFSALDSQILGFNTYVIQDACKGVELNKGDINLSYSHMKESGVSIIESNSLLA